MMGRLNWQAQLKVIFLYNITSLAIVIAQNCLWWWVPPFTLCFICDALALSNIGIFTFSDWFPSACLVKVALDEILRKPSSVQGWAVRLTLKLSFQFTLVKVNKAPGLATCVERLLSTRETCDSTLKPITSAFPLDSYSAGSVPKPSRPGIVLQHTCLRTTEMSINIKWKIDSICFTSNRTGIHRTKNGQWCVFQGHTTSFWRSVFEPKCWGMKRPGHMTALSVGNRAWIFRSPVFTSSPSTFPTTTDIIVKSVPSFVKPRMPSPVTKSNVDAR